MNYLKKEILETFPDISFLKGNDKQLLGYAEMFGNDCILLYQGINFTNCTYNEAICKMKLLNPKARIADGFENTIIGFLKTETGKFVFVHDRQQVINTLVQQYSDDKTGLFTSEDDIQESAWEMYDYNILGAFMEGVPAFAIICNEKGSG